MLLACQSFALLRLLDDLDIPQENSYLRRKSWLGLYFRHIGECSPMFEKDEKAKDRPESNHLRKSHSSFCSVRLFEKAWLHLTTVALSRQVDFFDARASVG